MNEEGRRMYSDGQDEGDDRFPPTSNEVEGVESTVVHAGVMEEPENLSREVTAGVHSSISSRDSFRRRNTGVSMATTQHESIDLRRHSTALSRVQTGRSQQDYTVGGGLRSRTSTRQSKTPMPNFGGGKPFPPALPEREDYVVEFDGPDDPMHAQNWPMRKKLPMALALALVTFTASFGSSIFSAATVSVAEHFGFSTEVGVLGVSLYVLGFATGPIIWAPMSELYGRKIVLISTSFLFSVFNIAVAVAKDSQTVFIGRFFAGFFGASPLACVGAVFADMFNNRERGLAITVFAMTVFCGPLVAPFIGGFINESDLGWRWTEYLVAIMGFTGCGLLLLLLEETYPPVILVQKAADLRRRTKNWGIHAKQEEIEIDFRELLVKNVMRPIRMLFSEPIVLALSIYMAFVYGLLYLFLGFYPIVFQEIHGFNQGVGGLAFMGMVVGQIFAGIYMVLIQPSYQRKLQANNNMPIPEWRLPAVIIGGIVYAIGLFWFGWTGYTREIHWIVPILSGVFTGFGILCIILQCMNYIIDAYLMFAASALAASNLLRCLAGSGFPLFTTYMIKGMGVQWAGTLLGCIAIVLVPVAILLYLKGAKIREKSAFAPTFSMANQANESSVESDVEKEGV